MRKLICFFLFIPQVFFAQVQARLDSIQKLSTTEIQTHSKDLFKELHQILAEKNNTDADKAKASSLLAWVAYFAGKYDENKKYSLKAIELFQKNTDYPNLAREYGELGFRMKDIDLKSAVFYMQKGLKIGEKYQSNTALTSLYNNYGTLKVKQNQLDSAFYFFSQSVSLCLHEKDSVGLSYAYNNLGDLFLRQSNFNKARAYFDKALEIRLKKQDYYGIADSYAYLGDLNFGQKTYENAKIEFLKSLKIAEKHGITNLMQYNYEQLATTYEFLKQYDLALYFANRRQAFGDSLLNIQTNAKIVELQTRFETAEKEKEILQHKILEKKRKTTILALIISLFGAGIISILIVRTLRLKNKQQKQEFELKTAIATIDTQNKLQEQRLSISRDLHDNIGAQLTFVISSIDTLKYAFKITDEKINQKLTSISTFTKETITELRDTIWAMNHSEIDLEEIQSRISNFVEKAKLAKETIDFKFVKEGDLQNIQFTSLQGMNIYRIIQEAINNALKYADASSIEIHVSGEGNHVRFAIQDNGKGFDQTTVDLGNGLRNMKKRADDIQAKLELHTEQGVGTKIQLFVSGKE